MLLSLSKSLVRNVLCLYKALAKPQVGRGIYHMLDFLRGLIIDTVGLRALHLQRHL